MKLISILGLFCSLIIFTAHLSHTDDKTTEMNQSLKDRANLGDANAAFQIGYSYEKGQGVKKNLVEAVKWYRMGAEKGDMQAALNLAGIYLKGVGVKKNEEKAIELYVQVGKSETWYAPLARTSLLILAKDYSLGGEALKPNKDKAHELFERLFEVETANIDRGEAQMNEAVDKFNNATNVLLKITPKDE